MTKNSKAKRKLKDIDFSSDGAHIALVSKEQGGPANQADYALVMKATNQFSDEFVEKAQQIRVTMELPDFLERFFWLREDDAETLAEIMGYVDVDDILEKEPSYELVNSDYQDLIDSKIASIDVMKSMFESKEPIELLTQLDEEEYLTLLKDQERLEKAFDRIEKKKSQKTETNGSTEENTEVVAHNKATVEKAKVKSGDFVTWGSSGGKAYGKVTSVKTSGSIKINENVSVSAEADDPAVLITVYKKNAQGGWEPTDVKVAHKASTISKVSAMKKATLDNSKVDQEDNMSKNESLAAEFEIEVVEKSALEAIQKAAKEEKEALEKAVLEQKEALQKALETIEKFETERKEAIQKARFASVKEAVKDEAKAEVLFKAVNLIEDEEVFGQVVDVLKQMTVAVENTELFKEQGASVEGEGSDEKEESAVAKILKSKK